MTEIAALVTVVMAALAALHAYWAAGGLWPGRDPAELAATVIGLPRMTAMPPAGVSTLVALALAAIAAWPLIIAPLVERYLSPGLATAGSLGLAALFLGRGVAGYLPALVRRHRAEPFAQLNRTLYSPLCLALGAGFVLLALNGVAP